MATLTPVATNRTPGINLATAAQAASSGGDNFANTGKELFYITNGGISAMTVTELLSPLAMIDGLPPQASRVLTINAGVSLILGPYPTGPYNDANGFMNFTYSAVSSVKILVFYNGP
jgi:hypothetical protein